MMVSVDDKQIIKLNVGTPNSNTFQVNLRDNFAAAYPYAATAAEVEFSVLGNLGSTTTGDYALKTGSWPSGSKITLILPGTSGGSANSPANGIIAGKGGDAVFTGCCDIYVSGETYNKGGPAILLSYPLTIYNYGVIGSGGTGGLGISQDRDRNNPGDGGGGAGINVGYSQARGKNFNGVRVYSSYLVGGLSTGINAGSLGAHNQLGIPTAKAVVTQGNALTLIGNGLYGGQS